MRLAFALGCASSLLLLTGCDIEDHFGNSQRFKEDFQSTHPLKSGGRFQLENSNGSIDIMGWERDTVEITGTKYAASEALLQAIRIDVVASPDAVRVRTVPPSGHTGSWGARYVIRVPQKVALDRITSSNGSIRVEALEGSARLNTSNGAVRVIGLTGPLDVRTSNGSVEITDSIGSVIATTSNGRIQATDVRGSLEATTSNGSISAVLRDPEPDRPIRLSSSNGSIDLTLEALRNNDVRATTSNSSITVRLPAVLNASLRAKTSNSSITSDYDVTLGPGKISKNHIEGNVGSGGPVIDLSTSNGGIKLLKL